MDITSFVVQGRDQALLYGDYSTYHSQLSKRILNVRKRLGIATRNRGKYQKRTKVTAEQVAANHECVALSLPALSPSAVSAVSRGLPRPLRYSLFWAAFRG